MCCLNNYRTLVNVQYYLGAALLNLSSNVAVERFRRMLWWLHGLN